MWLVWLLGVALVVFIYFKVRKKFKTLSPLSTITCCTGAVKTGKSTLATSLALRSYKKVLRAWKIRSFFSRDDSDKPLLYSNIPLSCEYVPLTTDILLRKQKIVPKSVVLMDEASLIADSQFIKDQEANKQMLLFFKLFGHSTHGGTLVIDTQSIADLHYAIKRCINNYLYIQRTRVYPLFLVMDVLEQRYSDDGTVVSNQTDDVDKNLRRVIIPKSVWKKFDCYCYSILTDNLPEFKCVVDGREHTLKTKNIPSFRDWFGGKEEKNNDKK